MLRLYQSCSQGNLILNKGLILQFLMHVFLLYLVQVKKWLCRECWVIGQDRYTNTSLSNGINLIGLTSANILLLCSLQGPVVKKSSGSWVITPVVEYYYLLPYAE